MTNGLVLRLDVEQCDLVSLRDAYGKMQAITASADDRGWIHAAELHGFNQFDCWHHSVEGPGNHTFPYNLFLPWHRAYLLYWEHIARDHNPNAIPPWWDWSSDLSHKVGIPTAFSEEKVNGEENPLFSGPVPDESGVLAAHSTRRFPGVPGDLPSKQDVTAVLSLQSFTDFSGQLEQQLHDNVHGWVGGIDPSNPTTGGDMGVVATAAFDPIFWAHHCMIDRLWYLWQLRHGVTNIPPSYRPLALAPFGLTVEDVLDIHHLGYDYATSTSSSAGTSGGNGGS